MEKLALLAMGIAGLAIAPASVAQDQYAWARVLDVQPITRLVRTEVPHRECRTEEVTRHGSGANPTGAMLAGALIGGVVGNQVGSGSGRRVATAAGVLIGSGMGHSSATNTPRTSIEERCEVYTEIQEEERFDGYRVSYEYGGAAYVTRTTQHPGDRIRVQVSVRPASF
ncbi:MAG: glycine zipper 2TM domain-containing protein [Gammaproteobacteria bacterium]